MDNTNFWATNQPVAYAVVNGLIGSSVLWGFWTPFITFLAHPLASSIVKQEICRSVNSMTTPTVLPTYSKDIGYKLMSKDNEAVTELNLMPTVSMWLLAGLAIVINMWMTTSIIKQGNLDINHIVTLNVIVFSVIVITELIFFIEVALRYTPYNLRLLYDDTINSSVSEIRYFV